MLCVQPGSGCIWKASFSFFHISPSVHGANSSRFCMSGKAFILPSFSKLHSLSAEFQEVPLLPCLHLPPASGEDLFPHAAARVGGLIVLFCTRWISGHFDYFIIGYAQIDSVHLIFYLWSISWGLHFLPLRLMFHLYGMCGSIILQSLLLGLRPGEAVS